VVDVVFVVVVELVVLTGVVVVPAAVVVVVVVETGVAVDAVVDFVPQDARTIDDTSKHDNAIQMIPFFTITSF
jgi:hypothetical protein